MVVKKTSWVASDGSEFDSEQDARTYEAKLDKEAKDAMMKYYHGFDAKNNHANRLVSEMGVWEIRGEDPNPDFGGHHSNPYIATVSGSFARAVEFAVRQKGWFTWGAGGTIRKIEIIDLPV